MLPELPAAAADPAGPSTKNWLLLLSLLTGLLLAASPAAHRARPAAAPPRLVLKSRAAPRLLPTVVAAVR